MLDMVQPDLCAKVSQKQQQQKQTHDLRARTRSFTVGDLVYAPAMAVHNQTGFLLTLCRGLVRCSLKSNWIVGSSVAHTKTSCESNSKQLLKLPPLMLILI